MTETVPVAPPAPAVNVDRVVYASVSLVPQSVYAQMERIRDAAVRNNAALGVYTALLHQSGWFVQWKEGPPEGIAQTITRVRDDRRHHSMRILHHSRGPRLLPDIWSMAIVQAREPSDDFARRVMALRAEYDMGVQYSPPTVWRRLSTPMQHPGAAHQHDPELFRRLMVCAGYSDDAFTLVRWLAEQRSEEVIQRRFAGVFDLDVGTDYVDFVEDNHVVRVIAMARNGLTVGLTRAFLPDYSHIVMLFTGDPERDLPMLRRVAQACGGTSHPPTLLGVGLELEAHQKLFELSRSYGLRYVSAGSARSQDSEAVWAAIKPHLDKAAPVANSTWPVLDRRYG